MTEHPPQGSSDTKDTPAGLGIGNIPPKVRKYGVIAALGLVAVGVMMSQHGVSCSSADARETVGNIAREQNALLALIRYQGDGSGVPVPIECAQDAECARLQKQFDAVRAEAIKIADECNRIPQVINYDNCPTIHEDSQNFTANAADGWGTTYYDDATSTTPPTQRKIYMAKIAQPVIDQWKQAEATLNASKERLSSGNGKRVDDAWSAAVQNLQYQLDNVIMTATDKDTGSVSCKADLVGEVPDWGKATKPITYTVEKTSDGDLYATVWGL